MSGSNKHQRLLQSHRAKGFTLIELMVVVAIVAIIASIAVPSFTSFVERSKIKTDAPNLQQDIKFACDQARIKGKTVNMAIKVAPQTNWSHGYNIWIDVDVDGAGNTDGVLDAGDEVLVYVDSLSSSVIAKEMDGGVEKHVNEIQCTNEGLLAKGNVIFFDVCPTRLEGSVNGIELTVLPSGVVTQTNRALCTGGAL